jgi:hypothetical protein
VRGLCEAGCRQGGQHQGLGVGEGGGTVSGAVVGGSYKDGQMLVVWEGGKQRCRGGHKTKPV